MENEEIERRQFQYRQWAHNILVSINIAILSYAAVLFHTLDTKVAVIEGNRWTAKDGAAVFAAIAKLNERFAGLPNSFPRPWVLDLIKKNRAKIEELERGGR